MHNYFPPIRIMANLRAYYDSVVCRIGIREWGSSVWATNLHPLSDIWHLCGITMDRCLFWASSSSTSTHTWLFCIFYAERLLNIHANLFKGLRKMMACSQWILSIAKMLNTIGSPHIRTTMMFLVITAAAEYLDLLPPSQLLYISI